MPRQGAEAGAGEVVVGVVVGVVARLAQEAVMVLTGQREPLGQGGSELTAMEQEGVLVMEETAVL